MITRKAVYYAGLCLLAILAALWVINTANSVLSYVPFTDQWNARKAVAKVERLEGQVDTLTREATGNAEIGRAVETYHTQTIVVREATASAISEARNAPDADTPLASERADRLRAHDQRLCDDFPALCANPDAS